MIPISKKKYNEQKKKKKKLPKATSFPAHE